MPEALETWPVALFERVLPRHLQIIYEINHRFLEEVRAPLSRRHGALRRMSIIDEEAARRVRMAHLAIVGSHKVNGVSQLHTDLMKQTIFADFDRLFPDKIINMTNGITPRRWLHQANPGAVRAHHRRASATAGSRDLAELQQARARWPRTPQFRAAVPRGQAREQGAARRDHQDAAQASTSTPRRCSTCRSSASTSTSGSS